MDGRPRVPKHLVEDGCMTKEARFHRLVHEEQPYSFFYQRYRTVLYRAPLNAPDFSLDTPYADPRYWSFSEASLVLLTLQTPT
jgi:hypothetical protein